MKIVDKVYEDIKLYQEIIEDTKTQDLLNKKLMLEKTAMFTVEDLRTITLGHFNLDEKDFFNNLETMKLVYLKMLTLQELVCRMLLPFDESINENETLYW